MLCKKGLHDLSVVGRRKNNRCAECQRTSNRKHYKKNRTSKELYVERRNLSYMPNLKAVRLSLGLTMGKMAALCGVGKSTIRAVENGDRQASERLQRKIAEAVAPLLARKRRAAA